MKKMFKNLFRRKSFVILSVFVLTGAIIGPAAIGAAEYIPDNDPIVTLSYIKDVLLPQVKEEIKEEVIAEVKTETQPEIPETYVGYEVVELLKDQKLTSENGTVELIVRPGSSANVISEIEGNGLSDISEMREVLDGEEVGINHQLIIPRNDGRGIVITSEKAYVLVRGDYTVSE